jgi:tetraacyldisaccharide 4'-kinase
MPFRPVLLPFSFIYYVIIFLRNFLYDKGFFRIHSLDAKVISVGNITWGGTGKTPAILYLAEKIASRGHRVVILTRGYGRDEESLFSKIIPDVPVIVGKDRVGSGKAAIEKYSADTVLLDDGFQHRRLKRDLDIVCIDAMDPFGNNRVIPAGSLREGLRGLKRADIFLITRSDLAQKDGIRLLEDRLKKANPESVIVKAVHEAQYFYEFSNGKALDKDALKHKNIILVSAIGNPYSFEKTILGLGLTVKKHFIFRDHYWYKEKDVSKIKDYCAKNNIDAVITTEKDAVRLKGLSFIVLRVCLKVTDNEKGFSDRLSGIYSG